MAGKMATGREKSRALGKGLESMFRSLEKRPVPGRLREVVDQLAGDACLSPNKKPS